MREPIETFLHRGVRVEIHYDDTGCGNPRDWDNGTKMSLLHRRYDLPNEIDFDPEHHEGLDSLADIEAHIRREYDVVGFKWVRGYEHGGLSLSTTGGGQYGDRWDSGIAGFIFMDREGQALVGTPDELVGEVLDGDVETYNAWSNGDVYGYVVDPDGENESCWGYIGDQDYCRTEAVGVADWLADVRDDKQATEDAAAALPIALNV